MPLSGGLDSSVVTALMTNALGATNVIALHTKHETTLAKETEYATKISKKLGVQIITFDIRDLHSLTRESTSLALTRIGRQENGLPSTQKVAITYTIAREVTRQVGGRLCGTLDGSEILVGYYPKDMLGGDILPLGGLLRTEVRMVAKELGLVDLPKNYGVVPGCGSIVGFVNKYARSNFTSERELDEDLVRLISQTNEGSNRKLRTLCESNRHKAQSTLIGRPAFYLDKQRRLNTEAWILQRL